MTFFKHGLSFLSSLLAYKNRTFAAVWREGERADVLRPIVSHESAQGQRRGISLLGAQGTAVFSFSDNKVGFDELKSQISY